MITVGDNVNNIENGWVTVDKSNNESDKTGIQQSNGMNGYQEKRQVITQQPILEPLAGMKPIPLNAPVNPVLGPFPSPVKCPHCFTHSISETVFVSGLATYLSVAGCCCFGLWCCCCAPFCLNSCKDVHHYCPNCKAFLGRYKKIG